MDIFSLFQVKGVIESLIYLFDFPEGKTKSEIRENTKMVSNQAVKVHSLLLDNDLIKLNQKNNFSLTDIGKEITKLLKDIALIEKKYHTNSTTMKIYKDKNGKYYTLINNKISYIEIINPNEEKLL